MTNNANIFEFDFFRWHILLLFLLPAFINLLLFVRSSRYFDKSRLNSYFSIFILCTSMWQMSEAFMRLSSDQQAATAWFKLGTVFTLFIIVFGVLFMMKFSDIKTIRTGYLYLLLILLPSIFFFVTIECGVVNYDIKASEYWFWVANPVQELLPVSILGWLSSGGILMLIMAWLRFFRRNTALARRQAFLLATGLTLPVIIGIVAEVLLPLFTPLGDLPLTAPLMTIFSFTTLVAITNHNFLEFSPKHHWDQITKSMNDGILIVDNQEFIMYANDSFCEITGYKRNELLGMSADMLFASPEHKRQMRSVTEERINRRSGRYEMAIRSKRGEEIWLLITGSPYYNHKGEVIGSIGVQTNITELKRKEKQISDSEKKLNDAQTVAGVGSWELDFNTGKSIWSDEACRIYGIPVEEKYNQNYNDWFSYIHPEDAGMVKSEIDRAASGFTRNSIRHRIVTRDKKVRYLHSVSDYKIGPDGKPCGLFGICHDLTKQEHMENALAKSEQLNSTFINESQLCIYFLDPETKEVKYANPAFCELLGYDTWSIRGMKAYDFADHDYATEDRLIADTIQNKKTVNEEILWKKKNGDIAIMLLNSVYLNHDGDGIIYVAAQDITERVKAGEDLKELNGEMETFIYKTSHDLRGPLASILGIVGVAKLEIDQSSLPMLDMIENAAGKLDKTLASLVKAMKIKSFDRFNDKIDFASVIDETIQKFQYYKGFERLKIEMKIDKVGAFYSNRQAIETIFQNFIENAIKYQNYSRANPFLKIDVIRESRNIRIAFQDNGIGIKKSAQENVFDMYYRATDFSSGTGLGLYLAKKAADLLKGKILLESESGKGTTFTLLIPRNSRSLSDSANAGLSQAEENKIGLPGNQDQPRSAA